MGVVFGLGNPGARYERSRHNAGYRVLEVLVARRKARAEADTPEYHWWRAGPAGRRLDLVAPLTFMNGSGAALAAWRERQGLDATELLVVVDDVYLPLGALRLRGRGSSGGHRGLASIEEALPGREYARLRIGVGAAADSAGLREHVLEEFAGDEQADAEATFGRAADAVERWHGEGLLAAMNEFNRRVRKEVSEP